MNDTAVLVVDDDPFSRRIMEMLLIGRMKLADVTIFEDSADFVTRVSGLPRQPELIFLDIHVQPHSGFEMFAFLRGLEAYAQTPVVALTASVMNDEVALLRAAGFHSIIAKPVDIETFPDTFARILAGEQFWKIIG